MFVLFVFFASLFAYAQAFEVPINQKESPMFPKRLTQSASPCTHYLYDIILSGVSSSYYPDITEGNDHDQVDLYSEAVQIPSSSALCASPYSQYGLDDGGLMMGENSFISQGQFASSEIYGWHRLGDDSAISLTMSAALLSGDVTLGDHSTVTLGRSAIFYLLGPVTMRDRVNLTADEGARLQVNLGSILNLGSDTNIYMQPRSYFEVSSGSKFLTVSLSQPTNITIGRFSILKIAESMGCLAVSSVSVPDYTEVTWDEDTTGVTCAKAGSLAERVLVAAALKIGEKKKT